MGLFSPKKKREIIDSNTGETIEIKEDIKCCVCNSDLGAFNRNKIKKEFYICDDCAELSAIMRHKKEVENYSDETLKDIIQKKKEKGEAFNTTNRASSHLYIDKNSRTLTVPYLSGLVKNRPSVDPDEIIAFESVKGFTLLRDGEAILQHTAGETISNLSVFASDKDMPGQEDNLKNCSQILVRIKTDLEDKPEIAIYVLDRQVAKSNDEYKIAMYDAEQIVNMLVWVMK